MNAPPRPRNAPSPLRAAVLAPRRLYVRAAWFSFAIGMLMLTPSWFMWEVYGRVLNSRNELTLWMMLLVTVLLYGVTELLDLVRARIMQRAAQDVDRRIRSRVFEIAFNASRQRFAGVALQAFADLRTLRDFIASPAVTAVMDIPAAVVMLIMMFLLSPWLGVLTMAGALVQVGIAWSTDRKTMPVLSDASKASSEAQAYASSTQRNAEVIESMGMLEPAHKRWMSKQRRFLARQAQASDNAGFNTMAARLVQTTQGSLILGAACWLALHGSLWGGMGMAMVASIVGARVLGPMALLVAQWRGVVTVRDAFSRLDRLLAGIAATPPGMPLPRPRGLLTVEAVHAAAPNTSVAILRGVSYAAKPGEVIAVIGPSGSGKTTLARLVVGLWSAMGGKVRLDGADVFAWNKEELGPHVGYLPQDVELFDGTVAENVARFGKVDMQKVREAIEQVGMAGVVDSLPARYDTRIGEEGAFLSGGQRQRLGIARAIYGDPQLVVLDEPNASLDEAGEQALARLLLALKARGATVVAITHRTTLLPAADKILLLKDGQSAAFGPRDEVLAALRKAGEQARAQAEATQRAASRSSLAPTSAP